MKKSILFILSIANIPSFAQVGIGTTDPDSSAALDISSTNKMLLPPRLTKAQMNAITNPAEGGMVYCKDCMPQGLYLYNGAYFIHTAHDLLGYHPVIGLGGATWLDRNVGAVQLATSSTDPKAYGDLYQWGRNSDGHQIRTSTVSVVRVTSGNEGSNYIAVTTGDWLIQSDETRWNGSSKGLHDPCPTGYRVPTIAEWDTEIASWSSLNSAGAFASPLKLPLAGYRPSYGLGTATTGGNVGYYCSSTSSGFYKDYTPYLFVDATNAATQQTIPKAYGCSVRCIKE